MQWISFLNDVISLFFLPQCVVCHPAKCFCNVTISLQRAHYGNNDSLWTVLQVTSKRGISFVIFCVFYFQIWPLRADCEQNSTRIGGSVLEDSNNSKTSAKNTVVKHPRPTGRRMNSEEHWTKNF